VSTVLHEPLADTRLVLPAGFALRSAFVSAWESTETLLNRLLIFEPPRPSDGHRYVLAADVAEGVGGDRSSLEVLRVGTLTEPDEEVATFVSPSTDPVDLAHAIDCVGRLYSDRDGEPALAAIEMNGFGIATQAELIRHIGYANLYVWQYEDARNPKARFARTYGWWTTRKTRPIIVARLLKALKSFAKDPLPDFVFHSPLLMEELRDLAVEPGYPLWAASAAPGAHDDCVLAIAIGLHVAQTLQFETAEETLSEQRRRKAEEKAAQDADANRKAQRRDYQNTAISTRGISEAEGADFSDEEGEDLYT
jgi:hypothetical protein